MADTAVAPAQRTLPHNLEAERSVLGAILVHNDAFNLAAQVIDSNDFYRDAHRRIFDKMVALNERHDAIDFVTLKEELGKAGQLDEVGGPAYVASLADGVPRATNVEYYAKIVKEKSTLRNLIYAANKILTNAYEADQESDLILDEAESAIFAVADDRLRTGFVPMRELVNESFPKIEQLFEQKRLITGVPTGFVDLDEMTRGLQPGDLIIVAARPSMGKTSLVLNVAQHVATQADLTVDYIQLMSSRGRFENRTLELASISRSLKGLAKELNVPIVVLSQLSRAPESRSDHRPQLSDLRESGALEQDADVVIFIYREDQYADKSQPPSDSQGVAELIIGKQRNGPTGVVKLAFLREFTRFENLAAS